MILVNIVPFLQERLGRLRTYPLRHPRFLKIRARNSLGTVFFDSITASLFLQFMGPSSTFASTKKLGLLLLLTRLVPAFSGSASSEAVS